MKYNKLMETLKSRIDDEIDDLIGMGVYIKYINMTPATRFELLMQDDSIDIKQKAKHMNYDTYMGIPIKEVKRDEHFNIDGFFRIIYKR